MDDEFEDCEETGGNCNMEYICDLCDEHEWQWDEWCVEIVGFTRMFRVGDKDVCEHCLRRLLEDIDNVEVF